METFLIFNNIRTAKILLRVCGQCWGTRRYVGGDSGCPHAALASPEPGSALAPAAACAQVFAAHLSQFK